MWLTLSPLQYEFADRIRLICQICDVVKDLRSLDTWLLVRVRKGDLAAAEMFRTQAVLHSADHLHRLSFFSAENLLAQDLSIGVSLCLLFLLVSHSKVRVAVDKKISSVLDAHALLAGRSRCVPDEEDGRVHDNERLSQASRKQTDPSGSVFCLLIVVLPGCLDHLLDGLLECREV